MAPEEGPFDFNVHMPLSLVRHQEQTQEDDDDLAKAIRLSLTSPTASPAEAKAMLDKRTKELFQRNRADGMAPHEAASRAAHEARRELGLR